MLKQQKVQFFNSESSFGSQSSLASSRYFDLTNQIAEQTQTVFLTLKRQFQPTPQLTNFDKIDYLHNRAKIISRDTIPDHLQYLNKISSPKESLEICKQCERKLQKFIKDYETLNRAEMLHKQFYNQYGRSLQNNVFFKKQNGAVYTGQINNGMLEPDVESINQGRQTRFKGQQDYKVTSRSIVNQAKPNSDKQVMELQEEITIMKKRESDLRKQFDYLLTTQKINCEKRVNTFLKAMNHKNLNPHSTELQENYKNESIRLGQEITRVLKEKEELINKNSKSENRIKELERMNASLKQELAGYRKLELSRVEDEDQLNQSFQSQQNNGDDSRNVKKLQLQIKKLISERDILKNQLNRERQNLEKDKLHEHSDQSKEIIRLKTYLETRNKENEELHRELDKTRVQLIQLKQENKVLNKSMSTIKGNSEELKKTLEHMDLSASNSWQSNQLKANNLIVFKNKIESKTLQKSTVSAGSKPNSFQDYQGEGIEGYPYFELLQKEFKIRFKRACLKNKQLLYKSNGLQIGVISEYFAPNVIKILIHITNSSDNDINGINVKSMNPNDNKIECDIERVEKLLPNQQVKIPVSCTIKNYPIGPLVFALDYATDTKHDVRLLLPAHIFKCVSIEPRTEEFYKPTKLSVKTQRKICKDLQSLKEYLNCENEAQIKVKIKHDHSGSVMFMNAYLNKDDVEIQYEHITGTEKFTEYFIKTFKTLLQKQN